MRQFLLVLLLLIGFAILPARLVAAGNVLVMISDNQNWNDLGCYGNPVVQTPNLDALAARSVKFQNAFATTASCGASRAVMYTGLLTHANGQYGHPHSFHNFHLMPRVKTIFQFLEAAGYRTSFLGKKHIDPDSKVASDFSPRIGGFNSPGLARAAGKFFHKGDGEEPFFCVIGFHDPHPTSREGDGWGIERKYPGAKKVTYDPEEVIVPGYLRDKPWVRRGIAGYYQQITRLDGAIGHVLQELEDSGEADETLILFFSDHGSSEPGAMANHYEPGIHVPFILHDPRSQTTGTNHALITLADVVPTILDWTGADGPKYQLHGRSLVPILGAPRPEGWDEVVLSHIFHEVTMYYPMRTIRTPRYKLIWNLTWRQKFPNPIDTLDRLTWEKAVASGEGMIGPRTIEEFLFRDQVELYDLKEDPLETHNLADEAEYAELRNRLSKKLIQRLKETGDRWLDRYELPLAKTGDSAKDSQTAESF